MDEGVHFGDDRDLVPPRYRDQIGRRYRSPHEAGYVKRRRIVEEFVRLLAERGETLTGEKLARMLTALDRGHRVSPKTLSFDLRKLRGWGRVQEGHLNSHRVAVEDAGGARAYASLRDAARQEGCSKDAARRWLALGGAANRRGQVWTYADPPEGRSGANRRPRGGAG